MNRLSLVPLPLVLALVACGQRDAELEQDLYTAVIQDMFVPEDLSAAVRDRMGDRWDVPVTRLAVRREVGPLVEPEVERLDSSLIEWAAPRLSVPPELVASLVEAMGDTSPHEVALGRVYGRYVLLNLGALDSPGGPLSVLSAVESELGGPARVVYFGARPIIDRDAGEALVYTVWDDGLARAGVVHHLELDHDAWAVVGSIEAWSVN